MKTSKDYIAEIKTAPSVKEINRLVGEASEKGIAGIAWIIVAAGSRREALSRVPYSNRRFPFTRKSQY